MRLVKVDDTLSVATQPAEADLAALRAAGFGAVINHRMAGEEAGQWDPAAEGAAAEALGFGYAHLPVAMGRIANADVRRFAQARAALPGPVVAHCLSGTRSLVLWAIGEVLDGRMREEDVVPFGRARGIDLRAAAAFLAARRV